jgi:hypothetical protein
MAAGTLTPRRVHSWPASLLVFAIATVGEFVALAGWYQLHTGHPLPPPSGWVISYPVLARALEALRNFLEMPRPALALTILLAGFLVERYMVVFWLDLPRRVITPSGNLAPRELVIAGVTIAELIVWTVWLELAEAQEPWFAAALLVVGIHLVHAYEVALLTQRAVRPMLRDGGVILLTVLEGIGGVWALWLASRGDNVFALLVLSVALLAEHTFQVIALKKDADAGMPQTV